MERVRIPHQTGRPVHGKLDSKNSYVARGITVALLKIFFGSHMANNRLSMRKITEALRLHFEHDRTNREIAQAIGISPTTVG